MIERQKGLFVKSNHPKHKKKAKQKWELSFNVIYSLMSSVNLSKHTDIRLQRQMLFFTQVNAYLLCLKTFEFVPFYTQKLKVSS